MQSNIKVSLAQINPKVGDLEANLKKHLTFADNALQADSNLIIFPELSITGYPPEDLLLREAFITKSNEMLSLYAQQTPHIHSILGAPVMTDQGLMNAAIHTYDGKIQARYYKEQLPNYGVFDEQRYFCRDNEPLVITINNTKFGITICEDLWTGDVAKKTAAAGAQVLISLNASPYEIDKHNERQMILNQRVDETGLPVIYVNQVGGQDELVFDGGSMVINHQGKLSASLPLFKETILQVEFTGTEITSEIKLATQQPQLDEIYKALVLGVRDYIEKNYFKGCLIGLSGGIDSALTLAIACDAIGPENITTVMMPSKFTADISECDAKKMANTLGVEHHTIAIHDCYQQFITTLQPVFKSESVDVTEQNIQARCRGIILMALSNKTGKIVLTTGNRSEMAVGYCTLYGDMAGGFAVLKDIPKTMVYELANHINRNSEVIPQRIIDRPPSAELADEQLDEDTLPPYNILDEIIRLHIDNAMDQEHIVAQGFDEKTVSKVIRLIKLAEYKRRQSPPGVRINHKAFSKDRRYPITSG